MTNRAYGRERLLHVLFFESVYDGPIEVDLRVLQNGIDRPTVGAEEVSIEMQLLFWRVASHGSYPPF